MKSDATVFPPRPKETHHGLPKREEMQLPELFPGSPVLPDLFSKTE